ncbi:MAG: hypothetical protein SGILL_005665 [Bacillariaceae sp.]
MLEEAEIYQNQHIVSWRPDGASFRVYKPDAFVAKIMPHYFQQTQFRSFQRMLNLYEFSKILTGPNRGCYRHPKFLRSNRQLCLEMRIRKKKTAPASTGAAKEASDTDVAASSKKTSLRHHERKTTGRNMATRTAVSQQQQQRQLSEEDFMSKGGLMSRSNQSASGGTVQQHQGQTQSQHSFAFHPVMPVDVHSVMMHRAGLNISPRDTHAYGTLASAPAPSNSADPASLHHHQPLPRHETPQHGTMQIDPAKIQLSAPHGLNMLPGSWNTTVYPTHYSNAASVHNQDERIHPSIFDQGSGHHHARLKALEDPILTSSTPTTARHHPLFSISNPNSTAVAAQAVHTSPMTAPHPQPEPQKDTDSEHDFEMPLSIDLEPKPFR